MSEKAVECVHASFVVEMRVYWSLMTYVKTETFTGTTELHIKIQLYQMKRKILDSKMTFIPGLISFQIIDVCYNCNDNLAFAQKDEMETRPSG